MGLIATALDYITNAKIKVQAKGKNALTATHFSSPGDDANPLPSDKVVIVSTGKSGGVAAVGYIDSKNPDKSESGEKRFYSRDSDGNVVAEVWMHNDGRIGIITDSDINLNGVTIDRQGNVNIPKSLIVAGIQITGQNT